MAERLKDILREPVNALTHGGGTVLALIGFFLLVYKGIQSGSISHVVGFIIFGISMVLLYAASTLYHSLHARKKTISLLRRLDHVMIYIMIAGSYTPIALIVLEGWFQWAVLGFAWAFALGGVLKKFVWKSAPHWLSILLYLVMGWMGVVLFPTLMDKLPFAFLLWIIIGGIAYTGGTVFLGLKKPVLVPGWVGPHEIWHLFVLAGTFSHYWAFYHYLPGYAL